MRWGFIRPKTMKKQNPHQSSTQLLIPMLEPTAYACFHHHELKIISTQGQHCCGSVPLLP